MAANPFLQSLAVVKESSPANKKSKDKQTFEATSAGAAPSRQHVQVQPLSCAELTRGTWTTITSSASCRPPLQSSTVSRSRRQEWHTLMGRAALQLSWRSSARMMNVRNPFECCWMLYGFGRHGQRGSRSLFVYGTPQSQEDLHDHGIQSTRGQPAHGLPSDSAALLREAGRREGHASCWGFGAQGRWTTAAMTQ